MIRTLHIINGLGTGGAERSLVELLAVLPDAGISPSVCVFHERAHGVAHLVPEDVEVHLVREQSTLGRVRAVRTVLREQRIELVHTTLFDADIVGRLATAGMSVPVLTSLVNMSYEPARLADPMVSKPKLRAVQAIDAVTARLLTTHFHAISNAVKESSVRHLRIDPDKITVIPRSRHAERLGKRTPERRRSVRSRLGIADDAYMILHVGRQEFQKDHATLLKAFAEVLPEIPNAVLVLAGRSGNATATIRPMIDALPAASLRELGHVENVPDLLAASDLFVFPSRYEGLGGAVVEAMLMAVPIVASDIPPLREHLSRTGLLVPQAEPDQLAKRVIEAWSTESRSHHLALLARERACVRFDHQLVTGAMAELLHSVVH